MRPTARRRCWRGSIPAPLASSPPSRSRPCASSSKRPGSCSRRRPAARAQALPSDTLASWRAGLLCGERSFLEILQAGGSFLDGRELVYYSNWITPAVEAAPLRRALLHRTRTGGADGGGRRDRSARRRMDRAATKRSNAGAAASSRSSSRRSSISSGSRRPRPSMRCCALRARAPSGPIAPDALPGGIFSIPPEQEPW